MLTVYEENSVIASLEVLKKLCASAECCQSCPLHNPDNFSRCRVVNNGSPRNWKIKPMHRLEVFEEDNNDEN